MVFLNFRISFNFIGLSELGVETHVKEPSMQTAVEGQAVSPCTAQISQTAGPVAAETMECHSDGTDKETFWSGIFGSRPCDKTIRSVLLSFD